MKTAKVDVTKVDKARLFEGKNGAKYLDLVLFENRDGPDKFGNDGFITQGCSKDEREQGVKMPIIGNWKRVGGKKTPVAKAAPNPDNDDDDSDAKKLPF